MSAGGVEITQLLERWKTGDSSVENELATRIYPVLRDLARSQVRRNSGILTLRATELANEAYARLCKQQGVDWQNRDHFYAIAATVTRRVVVDYLRQRYSEKRGGGALFVNIEDVSPDEMPFQSDAVDWLEVDQAMTELAAADPKCARVVELKLFSGLSTEQIAAVCNQLSDGYCAGYGSYGATPVAHWSAAGLVHVHLVAAQLFGEQVLQCPRTFAHASRHGTGDPRQQHG